MNDHIFNEVYDYFMVSKQIKSIVRR